MSSLDHYINNIRYTVGTTLIADNLEDLQFFTGNEESEKAGLTVLIKQNLRSFTDLLPYADANLKVENNSIDLITKFKYLGCLH